MAVIRSSARLGQISPLANREILLVEDQKSLAQMAAKLLHDRWGCRVLIATSLVQVNAIIAQDEHEFFLAVSDLSLPDAPNGEVVDVLLAAGIPVIAMTGVFDEHLYESYVRKGVIDYVLKQGPSSYEYLAKLVGRLHRNASITVLVVDDSPTFIDLTRSMLQLQNLRVLEAADAQQGLDLLEQHPEIRLVLVDYVMPGMDGSHFVINARRRFGMEKLVIVGMAGDSDRRLSAKFLKAGANDFIFKPFTYEELTCRVSQNLEMLESLSAMRHAAYFDALTGLPNRRHFFETVGAMHAEAVRKDSRWHLALLDVDFFKRINDTYGHDIGDEVLRLIGRLLQEHFQADFAARLGGEEFGIVIRGMSEESMRQHVENFRRRVEQTPLHSKQHRISFTVSLGVNSSLQPDLDQMLKLADQLLYQAKDGGRNRIVFNATG